MSTWPSLEAICLLLNSMAWSSIEHVPELCARYAKQLPPPEGAKGRGRRRAAAPKARPVARSYTYSLGEFQVLLKEEREKYARDKKYGILRKQRQKRNHGFLSLGCTSMDLNGIDHMEMRGNRCPARLDHIRFEESQHPRGRGGLRSRGEGL